MLSILMLNFLGKHINLIFQTLFSFEKLTAIICMKPPYSLSYGFVSLPFFYKDVFGMK